MIEPEKDGEENCKRQSCKYLANSQIPKVHRPRSVTSWHKRNAGREDLQMDILHTTNMNKSSEENECERGAIVLEKDTDGVSEQTAGAQNAAKIGDHEQQQGCDDGQIERAAIAKAFEYLNALL